ncbi:hypothetical protein H1235_08045 [Pseudoxanthomonas sp. NC8]|nr:hypothetical protein H1235_08045 [Pseudoxanthomonas sp. NC8]
MRWPPSAAHWSSHDSGIASTEPCPCSARVSSETNAPVNGGLERAMSATTRTTSTGFSAAVLLSASTHMQASCRSAPSRITPAAMRRRLSINASLSMIGTAHSSPSCSGVTSW